MKIAIGLVEGWRDTWPRDMCSDHTSSSIFNMIKEVINMFLVFSSLFLFC
jgi:hypothetical protein